MLQTQQSVRIVLFGRPHLSENNAPIKFKAPARAVSLLTYLLVHGQAPLGRDTVAFALWPDDIEADARANLRRHLFYLTSDVLPAAPAATPWIVADKRTIAWNDRAPAWCDVRAFATLAAEPATLAEAAALYRGDLLEGFEDEWLQAPRERLREQQIELLLRLIATSRDTGAHAAAISHARALLAIDPWREDGIRALIELRHATGDRSGALATYREFVKRLDAEMGVLPMAETTAVYERVASTEGAALATPSATGFEAPAHAFWHAPDSLSNADATRAVPSFSGRELELASIDSALWERGGVTAITGLGGMGKSALAREYARRNRERYAVVWWINAATEDGIIDGLIRLGSAFVPAISRLDDRRAAAETVSANVLLGLSQPVLLIFDNLDDERLYRAWSPGGPAQTLITSRHSAFGGDVVPVRLDAWTPHEATAYVRRELAARDVDRDEAQLLAETLGFFPLALAHAAAYLKSTVNVTVRRYLERITDHLARAPRGADYDRAVYATFNTAIARAEEDAPGAAAILCFAACFAPDAIPQALLTQAFAFDDGLTPAVESARDLRTVLEAEFDRDDALGALHRYSLLTYSRDTQTYTLHRLVQQSARRLIASASTAWNASAVRAACAIMSDTSFARWTICERVVPHVRAVLAALPDDAGSPEAAQLALRCGIYLRKRASFEAAETLLRHALRLAEIRLGAGLPIDIGEYIETLAALLRDTNRLAEAEPLLRRAVDESERRQGLNHPRVAAALNEFAIFLHYANRFAEAQTLYVRALAIEAGQPVVDEATRALRQHNLALVLHETHHLAQAQALLEAALEIDERVAGADHPDVASDLASLGWLLFDTGRRDDAEPLLCRALAIRESAYGADHPAVAHAASDLAVLYAETGRIAEAQPLHERALAIYETIYGKHHPVVAAGLNDVAWLLAARARDDEAERLYRRALESDENTYGSTHPSVARDLNNYAGFLRKAGRAAEALPLLARAHEIVSAAYDAGHPRVTIVRRNAELLAESESTLPWLVMRRSPSRGLR